MRWEDERCNRFGCELSSFNRCNKMGITSDDISFKEKGRVGAVVICKTICPIHKKLSDELTENSVGESVIKIQCC